MNTLYHKVALASVCTALGFVLGVSPEAKAVSFTFAPTISFQVIDGGISGGNFDGLGDVAYPGEFEVVLRGTEGEVASLAEFNIGSFTLAPNMVISSAVLQAVISQSIWFGFGVPGGINPDNLGIFGYVGNGTVEASDLEAGVFLNSVNVLPLSLGDILNFDVTPFVNQRFSNGNTFAGFGIRALEFGALGLETTTIDGIQPRLIIETADVAQSVPEPTTILTAAIALGWGGWLKRNNSSQQNKTKSRD